MQRQFKHNTSNGQNTSATRSTTWGRKWNLKERHFLATKKRRSCLAERIALDGLQIQALLVERPERAIPDRTKLNWAVACCEPLRPVNKLVETSEGWILTGTLKQRVSCLEYCNIYVYIYIYISILIKAVKNYVFLLFDHRRIMP